MNVRLQLPKNMGLMVLSLLLAVVLSLYVAYGKEAEMKLTVPVKVVNLPPGHVIVNKLPTNLALNIAGPKIFLLRLRPEQLTVSLDLNNVKEGTVAFPGLDKAVRIHQELRVTRIYPSLIEIKLEKTR